MTGGAVAGTKNYLKCAWMLDETCWTFKPLPNMHHSRDAHGIISWKDRFIIVVGSWHVESSEKTCEIFDIRTNQWHLMPPLNESTCAPGLVIIGNRYLYKLGGNTDVSKVEMIDLETLNLPEKKNWRQVLTTEAKPE